MHDYPTLHTLVKDARQGSPHEVRYLLIHSVDGATVTKLSQLVSGVLTEISTGTYYESEQKAQTVLEEWAGDGFKYQRPQSPAWDDLKTTVTLATLMGYTVIYDPDYRDSRNFTGAVPLDRWPGKTGKNGGYQYAFAGARIIAIPKVTAAHGINMEPRAQDFAKVMLQVIAVQKSIGRDYEFVLG